MLIPLRSRKHHLLVFLAAVLAAASSATAVGEAVSRASLRERIEAILARGDAGRGFWGILVVRLSDAKVLYARNPDHLFLPASNMKLFTTAAALERLGPDYVFRTTVESPASPDAEGRVGELVLVGRGDPNLSGRVFPYRLKVEWKEPADAVFQQLADAVAARGVREVTGNLVLDDSYFIFEPASRGWAADDVQWGYGAPVTALAFNDNALRLRIQPGAAVGEAARVWLEPLSGYYQVRHRVETVGRTGHKRIYLERLPGSRQLDVWGQIPEGSEPAEEWVAADDPLRVVGDLFLRALQERGIAVRGQVEVRRLSRLVAASLPDPFPLRNSGMVLADHVSLPLREDLRVINKLSQNLHAEMLLRTLGREVKNVGSVTGGLEVLEEFAAQAGIAAGEISFADGSGLSRYGLVAPRAVVKLLVYTAGSSHFDAFLDSLPIAGVDGTLAERFQGSVAERRVFAKTGTIEHVNVLSGYMDPPGGPRLAFCIIGNSHGLKAGKGVAIVDRIAIAILRHFSRRKR